MSRPSVGGTGAVTYQRSTRYGLVGHDRGEIEGINSTEAAAGDLRQAASPPPAVLQAIEARIAGEALDATGEEKARDAGWDPVRR